MLLGAVTPELNVSLFPSRVQTGNELRLSNVIRFDRSRRRSYSQLSDAFPRSASATRCPSGESRGCRYGRPDPFVGDSFPSCPTHTSVLSAESRVAGT